MLMQVEKEHVRELIDGGIVTPLPVACALEIETLLSDSYSIKGWGSVIDWSELPNTTELLWMQVDDDAAVAWARSTTAGQHRLAVLFYNGYEPCLVGEFAASFEISMCSSRELLAIDSSSALMLVHRLCRHFRRM
jgi:hypothetical protein